MQTLTGIPNESWLGICRSKLDHRPHGTNRNNHGCDRDQDDDNTDAAPFSRPYATPHDYLADVSMHELTVKQNVS